jgi:lipid II:glycine glycyltransferase (peptidoglycan interpeptide bridge formation enzyme)
MQLKKKSTYELKYFCSKKKYYQEKITFIDVFRSVKYIQFSGQTILTKFMIKIPYTTKHINLDVTSDELKQSFSKRVRAKINKATREGIEFNLYDLDSEKNIKDYIEYCNEHLRSKKLLYRLSEKYVTSFLGNYVVTYASFNGEKMVMHGYFLDFESKIVYAHESASQFRTLDETDNKINPNLISRANNFLHYQDMLYFQDLGMKIYDFGGYAINTEDASILNINRFKDGFRGEQLEQSHYESYMFYLINCIYHQIKPCVMKMRIEKIGNLFTNFK